MTEFQRKKSDAKGAAPFEIIDLSIFFTSLCNSGCLTCDIWRETKRVEFPLAAVEELLLAPSLKDVTFVLLGGEFTIHRQYIEIVRLLDKAEQPYVVLTNGILPERIYKLYDHVSLPNLSVSVDGFGDAHDRVRGYAGNFDRVNELISWVKYHHPETHVRICYTASEFNSQNDLNQVMAWARGLEIDVKIGAVTGAAIYSRHTESNLKLAEPELYRFESHFLEDNYSQLYRAWHRGWATPCTGIQHHPVLMQNGDLILCQNLGTVLGNVFVTPFEDLWQSEPVRAVIKSYETCNKCWMTCSRKYDAERLTKQEVKDIRLAWL